ncbi:MAG TPA: acetate--CoA ligase [Candidatus Limnocylindrales bacterium]|nr:acetate--CoA ligase [Candidatus Limnocylindrales bacterium]
MSVDRSAVEALAKLDVRFEPSPRVRARALVSDYDDWYRSWETHPDAFWDAAARDLDWFAPWSRVSEIHGSRHRWFVGGKTNLSYNCLERNIERGRGHKIALHFESERGPARTYTYTQAMGEVCRIANALKSFGIGKGDRVVLYMPLTPEGIFTMQACARIGAIHSVVYAGMGPDALRQRIEDSHARMLVYADATYRRGKVIPLNGIVEKALHGLNFVENVLVHRREGLGRLGWRETDFIETVSAQSDECPAEHMDADDPAFILYTSGTTGRPKGVVHVHGGYAVGVHTLIRNYYDVREEDVWWSTSDIGWIVGHSYICYGPMLAGCAQVVREGAPDHPDAGVVWSLVEKYRVTGMFTAPTAIRMFMRAGEQFVDRHDISSLRVLYCAGEPFNPEAWVWAQRHIGRNGAAVVDHYWQTEIASPMIGTLPSMAGRPGYVGKPMPGVRLDIVDGSGAPVPDGQGGLLVMKAPVPYMMRTLWNDPERYESYWNATLGGYVTGDIAVRDAEGYYAVLGRADDVLNVAGHRIGTAEVESALLTHAAVAESAVIGLPDPIKGECIKAFVVLRSGAAAGDELEAQLIAHVRDTLGPIAQPSAISFIGALPKTRSGKIMRRLLKARELGQDEGDVSTLED